MDLQNYREQIDKIDDELLRLFIERMNVVQKIALYKKEQRLLALDAVRESEKIAVIEKKAGEEMRPYAHKLYELLFELSRMYQEDIIK